MDTNKYIFNYISTYYFTEGVINLYLSTYRKYFEVNMKNFASKSATTINQKRTAKDQTTLEPDYIMDEFSLIMRNNIQKLDAYFRNPKELDIINMGRENLLQHLICIDVENQKYLLRNYVNQACSYEEKEAIKEMIMRFRRYLKEAEFKTVKHVREKQLAPVVRIAYEPGDFELKLAPYVEN